MRAIGRGGRARGGGGGRTHHLEPPRGRAAQHPRPGQFLKRAAGGGAADAEATGDAQLGQRLARRQKPLGDVLRQGVAGLAVKGGRKRGLVHRAILWATMPKRPDESNCAIGDRCLVCAQDIKGGRHV